MGECVEYVARAEVEDGGLYAHQSEHALFQIATPKATIRLSHGRLHQIATRDPTDQYDLPDHLTWQMNMAVDHYEINRDAKGVLGETFVVTRDANGNPIMTGMEAIRGKQEDSGQGVQQAVHPGGPAAGGVGYAGHVQHQHEHAAAVGVGHAAAAAGAGPPLQQHAMHPGGAAAPAAGNGGFVGQPAVAPPLAGAGPGGQAPIAPVVAVDEDRPLSELRLRLSEYRLAGKRQTVGHLRRLMAAVNKMRNTRTGTRLNVTECYASLGAGIASGTVSRWERELQFITQSDESSLAEARKSLPSDLQPILVDVQVTWAIGSVFVGVAAWTVLSFGHSWRLLALVSAVPPFAVLCCFTFIPESPRWLIANGREAEAKDVLRTIAKRNGLELVDVIIVPEEKPKEKGGSGVSNLWRTPQLRWRSVISCIIWLAFGFLYYGVILLSSKIMGDSNECSFDYSVLFFASGRPELYPTEIRSTGHAVSNAFARFGAVGASYWVASSTPNQQISILVGVVGVVGGLAAQALPNDHLEEVGGGHGNGSGVANEGESTPLLQDLVGVGGGLKEFGSLSARQVART
eukprot:g3800.t2